ncbi:hypothetical protein NicSoilB8_16710 [Arthrobacter sp. NicSoilB8]|nr:hypothetical protein NicSoilB8_16710 [Arthrobacter sp. NicSoilB8]
MQHQEGKAEGNKDHRRGGQDPAGNSAAHCKGRRGEGHGDRQRPARRRRRDDGGANRGSQRGEGVKAEGHRVTGSQGHRVTGSQHHDRRRQASGADGALPASTRKRRTNGNWKVVRRGKA